MITVTDDLAACHALRRTVFMEEQGVSAADEFDDLDACAIHLLAVVDGTPMGTARIVMLGDTGKIGRVCVLKPARGTGLGADLIRAALEHLRQGGQARLALLEAQVSAIGFYEKLGFTAFGPVFDDAGIPHRKMQRNL